MITLASSKEFYYAHDAQKYGGQGPLAVTLNEVFLTMSDFTSAIKQIQPSAKREGFAVVPNVTWNDVGALSEVSTLIVMVLGSIGL